MRLHFSRKFYITTGITLWVVAVLFALLPVWPNIYYRISPQTSETLASTIASTASQKAFATSQSVQKSPISVTPTPTPTPSLPDFNPTLPAENGLIIDKIGVRGQIHEGTNWEEILKKGIWRVPDFGTPDDNNMPIILAAHRWGYLAWSNSFRKLNSFYNLPRLTVGDKIKIIWNQRQYEYTIYSTATGDKITDYNANLILYTCQLWNSPVRFFVYANRSN